MERWAGTLSIAAGALHGGVAPEHFDEWWGYGVFFVVAGLLQAIFGLLLVTQGISTPRWPWSRVRGPAYVAGVLGHGSILMLWLVTRTVGVPWFGPEAGVVEEVGSTDALSKLLESGAILLLVRLAWVTRRGGQRMPAS